MPWIVESTVPPPPPPPPPVGPRSPLSLERPHVRFPFARDPKTGRVAVVEQGTSEHIMSCERAIATCLVGWRDERPEFGWPFPVFRTAPLDPSALEVALRTFEPRGRASVEAVLDVVNAAITNFQATIGVEDGG